MSHDVHAPVVSIGMPIYNGADTLDLAISSILNQEYKDFELIISDNCSTDGTEELCKGYASSDDRIRYIRLQKNIGAPQNFKSVLHEARGRYFIWASDDDVRSPDFLEVNVRFLEENNDYVASTCPNCFEGQQNDNTKFVRFALVGNIEERFEQFFNNSWVSHGIFYSVIRTEVLRKCSIVGKSFTGFDWAVNLFLATHGNIHRTNCGLAIFGVNGVSSQDGSWAYFRKSILDWILPFFHFSINVLKFLPHFTFEGKTKIVRRLIYLNLKASFDQSFSELYILYCRHLKRRFVR